jgi:hypothetical protein
MVFFLRRNVHLFSSNIGFYFHEIKEDNRHIHRLYGHYCIPNMSSLCKGLPRRLLLIHPYHPLVVPDCGLSTMDLSWPLQLHGLSAPIGSTTSSTRCHNHVHRHWRVPWFQPYYTPNKNLPCCVLRTSSKFGVDWLVCVRVRACVRVCVCEREIERERDERIWLATLWWNIPLGFKF